MMLQIFDRTPMLSADWLINNTDKRYIFKSLLELAQLVCSTGISNVYKPVKQGKELKNWINNHKLWTARYYCILYHWVSGHINCKVKTLRDLYEIYLDLCESLEHHKRCHIPKTAIFRYKKGYNSEYSTNSELPIDVCIREYRKYIKDYKYKK